jgi:hypothetical protein
MTSAGGCQFSMPPPESSTSDALADAYKPVRPLQRPNTGRATADARAGPDGTCGVDVVGDGHGTADAVGGADRNGSDDGLVYMLSSTDWFGGGHRPSPNVVDSLFIGPQRRDLKENLRRGRCRFRSSEQEPLSKVAAHLLQQR